MEKAKQNPENCPDQKSKANHYYGQYPGIIITDFYKHDVSIQGLVTSGYEKFEKCKSVASTLPTPKVVPAPMGPTGSRFVIQALQSNGFRNYATISDTVNCHYQDQPLSCQQWQAILKLVAYWPISVIVRSLNDRLIFVDCVVTSDLTILKPNMDATRP